MQKTALITGISGQAGSYLAELLLDKGYVVHGMKRRASSFNTQRIDHLIGRDNFHFHYGDMMDGAGLYRLITEIEPDEVYNLAAQSHVQVSFEIPESSSDIVAMGTLRLLEAIRNSKRADKIKFYQSSSSELFGKVQEVPQTETTKFYPRSPYACAKAFAHYLAVNYRESYDMFVCCGILFNMESPRRGETFVTRKITMAAARIALGLQDKLYLGNLNARRDWGYVPDYVWAMYLILQQQVPDDYVIATGITTTVRNFAEMAFSEAGIRLEFTGEGLQERGIDAKTGRIVIEVAERYFRPAEVELLIGDSTKAQQALGWRPTRSLQEVIKEMVQSDLRLYGEK